MNIKSLTVALVLSSSPALAADVVGVPVPELVGPYCARFSVGSQEFGLPVTDASTGAKWQFVLDRAAGHLPVRAELGAPGPCAIPGVAVNATLITVP